MLKGSGVSTSGGGGADIAGQSHALLSDLAFPSSGHTGLVPTSNLGTGTPDVNKFLRGDQVWEVPIYLSSGLATYFLVDTASNIGGSYKQALSLGNYTPGSEASITVNNVTDGQLLATFATNSGFPGVNLLSDGLIHIHFHGLKTGLLTVVTIFAEIYKRSSGGVETLIATAEESNNLSLNVEEFDTHALLSDVVPLDLTDRLVFKLYANVGGVGTPNVTLYFDGDTSTRIELPTPAIDASDLVHNYQVREKLSANRTYYVRVDGNDSNNGLTDSVAGAFLTIQQAVNVYQTLDCNGYNVYIQCGDGTYSAGAQITSRVGTGNLYILGNETTPANCFIDGYINSNGCFDIQGHPSWSRVYISGFKFRTTVGQHIDAGVNCVVYLGNNIYDDAAGYQVYSASGSCIKFYNDYEITGDALCHLMAEHVGEFWRPETGITVTLTGTPAFSSAFLRARLNGSINLGNSEVTFSGSATGRRYLIELGGLINIEGGAETYIPGSLSGLNLGGQFYGVKQREILCANRTYYVRTDGNDSNDGLSNTSTGAFLTGAAAVTAYQALDCNGFDVTIQFGAGTRTSGIIITSRVGGGNLYLTGDISTPGNVIFQVTGASCITISGHPYGSIVYVQGFKLNTINAGHCIVAAGGSRVYYGAIEFGANTGGSYQYHVLSGSGSWVRCISNCAISGGAAAHIVADGMGQYSQGTAVTLTLTGTPNFSIAFVWANGVSNLRTGGWFTFSGSATGKRYQADNSVIDTQGQATTYFPGDAVGTVSGFGVYA